MQDIWLTPSFSFFQSHYLFKCWIYSCISTPTLGLSTGRGGCGRGVPANTIHWTNIYRWPSIADGELTLNLHRFNLSCFLGYHPKHKFWINVGPPSTTLAQHWPSIGLMFSICFISAKRAHWIVADFREKTVISGDKRRHLSSYIFFFACFFVALINFFSNR